MNERLKQVDRDIALLQKERESLLEPKWVFGDTADQGSGLVECKRILLKVDDKLMWFTGKGDACHHHVSADTGARINCYKKTGNIFGD